MLPSQSDDHLLRIVEDVGISYDASLGSPSSLLGIIRANEIAQADIAKAKEARLGSTAPLVVAGGDEGGSDMSQAPWLYLNVGLVNVLNPAWLLAGRAFALKTSLLDEGFILEY